MPSFPPIQPLEATTGLLLVPSPERRSAVAILILCILLSTAPLRDVRTRRATSAEAVWIFELRLLSAAWALVPASCILQSAALDLQRETHLSRVYPLLAKISLSVFRCID